MAAHAFASGDSASQASRDTGGSKGSGTVGTGGEQTKGSQKSNEAYERRLRCV